MLPIPNAATAVKNANNTASHFCFRPAPAHTSGHRHRSSFRLDPVLHGEKASAYFVAMPKTPVSHIHSTAPGARRNGRRDTDDIAVPIVAARAVVSEPNWLMSPSPRVSVETKFLSLFQDSAG